MNKEELIFKTILSSNPLRQMGEDGMPTNYASGVIINYRNKKVLLSVFHATKDFTNWTLEIKSDFKTGTLLKKLGLMGSAVEFSTDNSDINRIDFSFTTLPDNIKTYHQLVDNDLNQIYEHERIIVDINFELKPSIDRQYSFFGQTEIKTNGKYIIPVSKLTLDMKFIYEDKQFYHFKLPFKHPGHTYFKGTSGAPILDNEGNLVSLVCKGDIDTDIIYGLKLNKYKSLIDIQVDDNIK